MEAKAAVESGTHMLKEGLSKEDAEALKEQVEAVGGKVEVECGFVRCTTAFFEFPTLCPPSHPQTELDCARVCQKSSSPKRRIYDGPGGLRRRRTGTIVGGGGV